MMQTSVSASKRLVGTPWVLEPDDAVMEYLQQTKQLKGVVVVSTIIQSHGVIVALGGRRKKRDRYLGWFNVAKRKYKMAESWVYRGKFGEFHLWQSKQDDLPG